MAIGDEIIFTIAKECEMIDDPSKVPPYDKVVFTRLASGSYNYQ